MASEPRPLIYSKTGQHAVQVMVRVAEIERESPGWVPVKGLAKAHVLTEPTVAQVVDRLCIAGLLAGRRGTGGGVRLARPAVEIRVVDVVVAIDGRGVAGRCALGLAACSDQEPCAAHEAWSKARAAIEEEFEKRSLRELVSGVPQPTREKKKETEMARSVFTILDELAAGIEELKQALAPLAALSGGVPAAKTPAKPTAKKVGRPPRAAAPVAAEPEAAPKKSKRRPMSPKLKALRQMQGKFLGVLRGLPTAQREELKKIQREKGYEAALAASARLK